MAVYDRYATRPRVKAGVAIKQQQAQRIFALGLSLGRSDAKRVLEIGPGDGYVAALAAQAQLPYVAVEGSITIAQRLQAGGVEVHPAYVPPLPTGIGNGFGSCFLLHVIEHMKTPADAAQLVTEIRDRLAPGGVLVIACPDASRWGTHFYDCDYTHSYPMTRRRLAQLLRDQALEPVLQTVYTGPVFGLRGLPLSWAAKLLYWPLLDDLVGPKRFNDVMNRGFLTFLPNLLTIARRAPA